MIYWLIARDSREYTHPCTASADMSVASVWIVLTHPAAVGIPLTSAATAPVLLELTLLLEAIRTSHNLISPAPEPDMRAHSLHTRVHKIAYDQPVCDSFC